MGHGLLAFPLALPHQQASDLTSPPEPTFPLGSGSICSIHRDTYRINRQQRCRKNSDELHNKYQAPWDCQEEAAAPRTNLGSPQLASGREPRHWRPKWVSRRRSCMLTYGIGLTARSDLMVFNQSRGTGHEGGQCNTFRSLRTFGYGSGAFKW